MVIFAKIHIFSQISNEKRQPLNLTNIPDFFPVGPLRVIEWKNAQKARSFNQANILRHPIEGEQRGELGSVKLPGEVGLLADLDHICKPVPHSITPLGHFDHL